MGLSRAAKVCRFPGRGVGFRVTEAFWGDGLVWLRRAAGMVDGVAQADVSYRVAGISVLHGKGPGDRECIPIVVRFGSDAA